MKLLIYSDLHLEHRMFTPPPEVVRQADVVVLAGDIYPGERGMHLIRRMFPDSRIVFVPGNHELYGGHWERTLDVIRKASQQRGIDFLEDGEVTIDGVRFLGTTLWTDFDYFGSNLRQQAMEASQRCLADYISIKAGATLLEIEAAAGYDVALRGLLKPEQTRQRHHISREWLAQKLSQGPRDRTVVVTHHFPHAGSCAPIFKSDLVTAAFGTHMPIEMMARCALWIHGHTHTSFDYQVTEDAETVRVICNPRGYPLSGGGFENPRFDEALLVEV